MKMVNTNTNEDESENKMKTEIRTNMKIETLKLLKHLYK